MAKLSLSGRDYPAADKFLGDKTSRKIGNNTVLHRTPGALNVKLHSTDVVTLHRGGTVTIRAEGYHSVTTKERINQFLPGPFRVSQDRFAWYLRNWKTGERWEFIDGMSVDAAGRVVGTLGLYLAPVR